MNIKMLNTFTAEGRPRLTSEQLAKLFGDTWKTDLTYLIKEAGVPVGQFRDPATGGIFFQLKSHEAGAATASSPPPPGSPGADAGKDEAPAEASGPTDEKAPPSSAASPAGPSVATIQTGAREAAGLPPVPFAPSSKAAPEVSYHPHGYPPGSDVFRVALRNFRITSSGGRTKITAAPATPADATQALAFASAGENETTDIVLAELHRPTQDKKATPAKARGGTLPDGASSKPSGPGSEELEDLEIEEAPPLTEKAHGSGSGPSPDAGAPEKKPEKSKAQLAQEIRDSEIPADLQEASVGMMEQGADPTAGMVTGDDRAPI